jgi:hypothetical protein
MLTAALGLQGSRPLGKAGPQPGNMPVSQSTHQSSLSRRPDDPVLGDGHLDHQRLSRHMAHCLTLKHAPFTADI